MTIIRKLMNIFGKLVHMIFGKLVNIFGKLVNVFAWKLVPELRNKFQEIWGRYGNRRFRMILMINDLRTKYQGGC